MSLFYPESLLQRIPQLFRPFLLSPIDHVKIQIIHQPHSGTDLYVDFIDQRGHTVEFRCHRKKYTYFSLSYVYHPEIETLLTTITEPHMLNETTVTIDHINGTLILLLFEKVSLTQIFTNYLFQIYNLDGSPLNYDHLDLDEGFKTLDYSNEATLLQTLQTNIKTLQQQVPFPILLDVVQHNI